MQPRIAFATAEVSRRCYKTMHDVLGVREGSSDLAGRADAIRPRAAPGGAGNVDRGERAARVQKTVQSGSIYVRSHDLAHRLDAIRTGRARGRAGAVRR